MPQDAQPAQKLPLFDATVHQRYRVTIPGDALAPLPWRDDVATGDKVTLEVIEAGRLRIRPIAVLEEARASAANAADAQSALADLAMYLFEGTWSISKRDGTTSVTLTRILALHVLDETGEVEGLVYVWADSDRLELWSVRCRSRMIAAAQNRSADCIPG